MKDFYLQEYYGLPLERTLKYKYINNLSELLGISQIKEKIKSDLL
jgi:hypothetical protein